jgi:hypothetical protein
MQDLASKALPQIYLLGSEEVKKELMESLKESFTGGPKLKKGDDVVDKDENMDMLLEFKDNTSTE